MPRYTFENTLTGEEFDIELSMDEREKFFEENKHFRQCFNKIYVGTVSGSSDWHYTTGVNEAFAKMKKHYNQKTREKYNV
jgi:hypothetical protein